MMGGSKNHMMIGRGIVFGQARLVFRMGTHHRFTLLTIPLRFW